MKNCTFQGPQEAEVRYIPLPLSPSFRIAVEESKRYGFEILPLSTRSRFKPLFLIPLLINGAIASNPMSKLFENRPSKYLKKTLEQLLTLITDYREKP